MRSRLRAGWKLQEDAHLCGLCGRWSPLLPWLAVVRRSRPPPWPRLPNAFAPALSWRGCRFPWLRWKSGSTKPSADWSSGLPGDLVKRYAVGLGHRGLGPKRREGDHLTPEGRFYLCTRNERSQFHLFLGLSYPDEAAAARGLQGGTSSRRPSMARSSGPSRRGPALPGTRALGGAVGIHGGGASADWTWGCIALENPEIEELWVACPIGSPILIEAQ